MFSVLWFYALLQPPPGEALAWLCENLNDLNGLARTPDRPPPVPQGPTAREIFAQAEAKGDLEAARAARRREDVDSDPFRKQLTRWILEIYTKQRGNSNPAGSSVDDVLCPTLEEVRSAPVEKWKALVVRTVRSESKAQEREVLNLLAKKVYSRLAGFGTNQLEPDIRLKKELKCVLSAYEWKAFWGRAKALGSFSFYHELQLGEGICFKSSAFLPEIEAVFRSIFHRTGEFPVEDPGQVKVQLDKLMNRLKSVDESNLSATPQIVRYICGEASACVLWIALVELTETQHRLCPHLSLVHREEVDLPKEGRVDGDDLVATGQPFRDFRGNTVAKFRGWLYDAPEQWQQGGQAAAEAFHKLLWSRENARRSVYVRWMPGSKSYGRVVGDIIVPRGQYWWTQLSATSWMIGSGWAVPFHPPPGKAKSLQRFMGLNLQVLEIYHRVLFASAVLEKRGMWQGPAWPLHPKVSRKLQGDPEAFLRDKSEDQKKAWRAIAVAEATLAEPLACPWGCSPPTFLSKTDILAHNCPLRNFQISGSLAFFYRPWEINEDVLQKLKGELEQVSSIVGIGWHLLGMTFDRHLWK